MKKNFVKPEMKSVKLRDNILAGSFYSEDLNGCGRRVMTYIDIYGNKKSPCRR